MHSINYSLTQVTIIFQLFTVPEKPQNLSVLEVTSTTIKISWKEPLRLNGAIHGYRVYSVSKVIKTI